MQRFEPPAHPLSGAWCSRRCLNVPRALDEIAKIHRIERLQAAQFAVDTTMETVRRQRAKRWKAPD